MFSTIWKYFLYDVRSQKAGCKSRGEAGQTGAIFDKRCASDNSWAKQLEVKVKMRWSTSLTCQQWYYYADHKCPQEAQDGIEHIRYTEEFVYCSPGKKTKEDVTHMSKLQTLHESTPITRASISWCTRYIHTYKELTRVRLHLWCKRSFTPWHFDSSVNCHIGFSLCYDDDKNNR